MSLVEKVGKSIEDIKYSIESKEIELRAKIVSTRRTALKLIEEAQNDSEKRYLEEKRNIETQKKDLIEMSQRKLQEIELEIAKAEEMNLKQLEVLLNERKTKTVESCLEKLLP